MTFYGSNSEQYITGRELGRGGEGIVYELQNDGSRVLKHYTEPLSPRRIQKLHKMVAMYSPAIAAYAAWPEGLVRDSAGTVCGFVMKKLGGYVPLHMIFSPMDRKRMFPDKGYNFLVHVARNLAIAFHKLHEAGLVVGDVNEGNILLNKAGMISFIDCDSFQVMGDDGYFFCEVGVPRYTPPELLEIQTFEEVVRTANTDSFSMAVLIFQLLFLGRHPFAGKNRTKEDIDEETAIRRREFAYSLDNHKKKLQPPNDSWDIRNLSELLIAQFHSAFETAVRPLPAEWVGSLEGYLLQMITCSETRLHSYPSKMQNCPWCHYLKTRGIMYFLDDSYLKASAQLDDIEQFVNGFKIEQLELKKWDRHYKVPSVQGLLPEKRWHTLRIVHWVGMTVFALLALAGLIESQVLITVVSGVFGFMWSRMSPFYKMIKKEVDHKEHEYIRLSAKVENMIQEHDSPPDVSLYNKGVDKLYKLVNNYRKLPEEQDRLRQQMEEHIYNDQLSYYLKQFDILSHTITSFGPAKKQILLDAGIRNASDIQLLKTQRVAGIGPKNIQILLDWQRQMSNDFVYIPDTARLATGMEQVKSDVALLRQNLERAIRQEYQALNHMKHNINNRALVLENQVRDTMLHAAQTEADRLVLKKFARFVLR